MPAQDILSKHDESQAAIAVQLSHSSDSSAVSQLGGKDKRFNKEIMSRYTCASYDPFGGVVQVELIDHS